VIASTLLSLTLLLQQEPASTPSPEPPPDVAIPVGETEPDRPARAGESAQNAPMAMEITPESAEAIRRGLRYLASLQNDDGSFGRGRFAKHVGITALCGLAFMGDGNLPGRGAYGEVVRKALEFVLRNATETGLLAAENSHGPMYGHGFATLFLGEIYGMSPEDGRVRDALVRAVELIVNSQNEEGGWRYNPVPYDADVSVTICEVMGLRSARNAGIKVPKATIDRAIAYVRGCQNGDGGFRYMTVMGTSAWPRTAAGVASLFYAGIYEDDSIRRGLGYLRATATPDGGGPNAEAHYFYGHYYAVQCMYLAGGDLWGAWWPLIRDELVEKQTDQGGWSDYQAGPAYSTAMGLIVLQMPNRYLPIFQK
jgi:Prenyltransferase and squalene oxidase repeat